MFFSFVLLGGAALGLLFGIVMTVWMWRTRPSRTVPAYRRSAPDGLGFYPAPAPALYPETAPRIPTGGAALGRGGRAATRPPTEAPRHRLSVDGRRRDLSTVAM